jgi:hypothetical protein
MAGKSHERSEDDGCPNRPNRIFQGLRALSEGAAPILLQYRDNVNDALTRLPVPDLKASTISDVPINIVISTKRPDAAELVSRFDAAIVKLRQEGRLRYQ